MTSKSASLISYDHPASEEDLEKFKRAIQASRSRFTYKRIKGGYDCHCSVCGQDFHLTDEQLLQTKEAGLCFKCAYAVKIVQKRKAKETYKRALLSIINEKGAENGYEVFWKGNDDHIDILKVFHVLHYDNQGGRYVYGIVKNLGYSLCHSENKNYWRKEYPSYNPYITYFISVDGIIAEKWRSSKKAYYEELELHGLKSNQITFIKNGIYNKEQIDYIQLFDLNYPEQVHKYSKYIELHRIPGHPEGLKLSANILDYLVRNNLSCGLYFDYMRGCKDLGIKPGKPKDLSKAHDDVVKMVRVKDNEAYRKKITERHLALMKNEWSKGKFAIHSFKDYFEMEIVAEKLKNCIAKLYVKPYSDGTTDVYYGTEDGEITFALEVVNGSLKQLRGVCNSSVNESTAKFVNEWCRRKFNDNARTEGA